MSAVFFFFFCQGEWATQLQTLEDETVFLCFAGYADISPNHKCVVSILTSQQTHETKEGLKNGYASHSLMEKFLLLPFSTFISLKYEFMFICSSLLPY